MRKLLTGILLAVSLSTMADVASDLKSGLSASETLINATASCDNSACQEKALVDMLNAGVPLNVVAQAAADAGMTLAKAILEAMLDTGMALDIVTQAAADSGMTVSTIMKAAKSAGYIDSVIVTSVSKAGASPEDIKQAAEEAGIAQENVIAGITTAEEGATGAGATNTSPIYIPISFKQVSSPTPTVNREALVEEAISPN